MFEVAGPRDWPLVFWRLAGQGQDITSELPALQWVDKTKLLAGLDVQLKG